MVWKNASRQAGKEGLEDRAAIRTTIDAIRIKQGEFCVGEVIDKGERRLIHAQELRRTSQQMYNLEPLNTFLIELRRKFLTIPPSQ